MERTSGESARGRQVGETGSERLSVRLVEAVGGKRGGGTMGEEGTKQALESSSEYLTKHNFKTLIEWLSAEVILNRPKDPLAFIRDVICEKLDKRDGKGYSPQDTVRYAKEAYQEAQETADEDGQIHPRKVPRKPSTLADTMEMRKRLETLEQAIKSSRSIAKQLDPYDATEVIVREVSFLFIVTVSLRCVEPTLIFF